MDYKKEMSLDDLDLLVRALDRVNTADPHTIDKKGTASIFYNGTKVHIFWASGKQLWITLGDEKLIANYPSFFCFRSRRRYDAALTTLNNIRDDRTKISVETEICRWVPVAKDIIAERSLLNDHKD
jgi:hypothetical protein